KLAAASAILMGHADRRFATGCPEDCRIPCPPQQIGRTAPQIPDHRWLLRALETIAAQILRLDQREHDLVSFDAANFKALRAEELRMTAQTAAEKVIKTGVP